MAVVEDVYVCTSCDGTLVVMGGVVSGGGNTVVMDLHFPNMYLGTILLYILPF